MEIILLQRVEKLGQMGELVKVKSGYGRNFLLPQGKAVRATPDKIEEFKAKRSQLEAQNLTQRKEAEAISEKMQGLRIVIIRSAGESGYLYGSIRAQDLVEGIKAKGFTIGRSQVILDKPIKTLGLHQVRISLHPEVLTAIQVSIALTEEEALAQLPSVQNDSSETETTLD